MGAAFLALWSSVDIFVCNYCYHFCDGGCEGLEERMAEEHVGAVCFEPSV